MQTNTRMKPFLYRSNFQIEDIQIVCPGPVVVPEAVNGCTHERSTEQPHNKSSGRGQSKLETGMVMGGWWWEWRGDEKVQCVDGLVRNVSYIVA